jgi:hypothetical protein
MESARPLGLRFCIFRPACTSKPVDHHHTIPRPSPDTTTLCTNASPQPKMTSLPVLTIRASHVVVSSFHCESQFSGRTFPTRGPPPHHQNNMGISIRGLLLLAVMFPRPPFAWRHCSQSCRGHEPSADHSPQRPLIAWSAECQMHPGRTR